MCDPVSLGIMAATKAGSTYLQNKAADKVKSERRKVTRNTDADLQQYREKARAAQTGAVTASSPEDIQKSINQATADRTASYEGVISDPQSIVSDNASDAAKRSVANALTESALKSKAAAGRRAALESYGDAVFGRDVAVNRAGGVIDTQGDFARGRAGVAELQLEEANNAGQKYANLAGLVDAIGTVAGAGYGMYQGMPATRMANIGKMAKLPKAGPSMMGPLNFYDPQVLQLQKAIYS